jgi:hypothetical protein
MASRRMLTPIQGCGRLSQDAARAIAESLGLQGHVPSVFQGRIGGAKGVWMIDALGETLDERLAKGKQDRWIEITDSQVKFEGPLDDQREPDPQHVTFEVVGHSQELMPGQLNLQFITILVEQGVPAEAFEELLREDLDARVADLMEAMESALGLRKWNQDMFPVLKSRAETGGIEWGGGIPLSLAERINWFTEVCKRGFPRMHSLTASARL